MTKSFRDIIAQKGVPRTNSTSDKPSRGPNKRSAIRKDIPIGPTGVDKHGKNKVQREVLKYLRRKLLPPH